MFFLLASWRSNHSPAFQAHLRPCMQVLGICSSPIQLLPTSHGKGCFFYTHKYIVPTNEQGYGKLQSLEAATLRSIEWPKPDAFTIISLKAKIVTDVRASLKFGKASRSVGLGWCCPAHVFANIFGSLPFHHTNTMYVCKDLHYDMLEAILGEKWGYLEGLHNGDRFRCQVGSFGIAIRFIKARSTLYVRFFYERWMCKLGEWIPLQSTDVTIEPFEIVIKLPSGIIETVQVNKHWTLANVREHLLIMGLEHGEATKFHVGRRKVNAFFSSNYVVFMFSGLFLTLRCVCYFLI